MTHNAFAAVSLASVVYSLRFPSARAANDGKDQTDIQNYRKDNLNPERSPRLAAL